jgi:hypothetical protein
VSAPSWTVAGLLTALAIVLAGSLNKWRFPTQLPILQLFYLVPMQLSALLRAVLPLTLVWWRSLQGLRWPARELRIVTGLGDYIFATLIAAMLHSHKMGGMQYHWLDQLLVGIYLWTLSCWILASAT